MSKKSIVAIAIVAGLLGFGATTFFIWRDFSKVGPVRDQPSEVTARPSASVSNGVESAAVEIPDLDRPVNVSVDLPANTIEDAKKKIAELTLVLKSNKDLFGHWVELGLYRRLVGDYGGASAAWEYAGILQPKNPIPFHNLGDLYTYQLKNGQLAEKNYLIALKDDPAFITAYEKLYELYSYILKDDEKAKSILKEGISKNLDTSGRLKYLLDNY